MDWYFDFLKYLKSFDSKNIAIACSGGADSMFLANCLYSVFGVIPALIVDHKLQENSTDVALQTKSVLASWGLIPHILTWNHEKLYAGIEEKARIARHNLIEDFCVKNSINTVFLAHHIDDKIETFLLNASRGCGLAGLTSMREISGRGGVEYIRPMVYRVEKSQIIEFMQARKHRWFEDKTNQNLDFKRNKIRAMLDFSRNEKNGILQTIKNLQAQHDEKVASMLDFIETNLVCDNGICTIQISKILELDFSSFRLFASLLIFRKIYKLTTWELRQAGIWQLYEWLNSSAQVMTFAKCRFFKKNGFLAIVPEWQRLCETPCIVGRKVLWNGLFCLISSLDGVIMPLGKVPSNLRKSLKIKEKFLDIAHLPIVICDGNFAVPHLGILGFDVKII